MIKTMQMQLSTLLVSLSAFLLSVGSSASLATSTSTNPSNSAFSSGDNLAVSGNTGVVAMSILVLVTLLAGCFTLVYYDYRRHKRPLTEIDRNVRYTLVHHVRVVTLPTLRYRLSFQFETKNTGQIHKF